MSARSARSNQSSRAGSPRVGGGRRKSNARRKADDASGFPAEKDSNIAGDANTASNAQINLVVDVSK